MEADDRLRLNALVIPEFPTSSQEQTADRPHSNVAAGEQVAHSDPTSTVQSGKVADSDRQSASQSGQVLRPLSRRYPTYAETLRLPDSRRNLRFTINAILEEQGMIFDSASTYS